MTQPIRPMLGEVTLQQAQLIGVTQGLSLGEHDVPGLEGDFLQRLGRIGGAIEIAGIQSGPEAREGLNDLREAFRAGEPVSFTSDIVSATSIDQILIEEFEISERAGHPDAFAYRFLLREMVPAPEPEPEEPIDPVDPPVDEDGTLVVNVVKENDPNFDASGVTLRATGSEADGTPLDRTLTNRNGNRWTEDPFPPGRYTVEATAPGAAADGTDLRGSETAEIGPGETEEITITLRDGAVVALRFLIHFRFDSAFIEPCLKQVVRQVADFAGANADMKLVVVGHTDLAGSDQYNQSLSERRARSAFAMLRFGNDATTSESEWDALRRLRTPGTLPSVNDSWGAREYQQILQDLGHYKGAIDGDHGPLTDTAVRDFQGTVPLPQTGQVNDATWGALIHAYLADPALSVPDDRFLPNCPAAFLRWLGCGELDPVRDTQDAWRPNRRTEFLFVRADALPADVPAPDTIDLPTPGAGAPGWCLNDSGTTKHCCFTERYAGVVDKEGCAATQPRGPRWTRVEAEATPTFTPRGRIRFSDGTPYVGEYVLTAPDGEYMDGEVAVTSGGLQAGTPRPGRTAADGTFAYPDKQKRPGIFILEVKADVVAHRAGTPAEEAKGPIVCKRLASDADLFDVEIVDRAAAGIIPEIEMPTVSGAPATGAATDRAVIVKKPHTLPARRRVIFRASAPFTGSGEVTITAGAGKVLLFDAPVAGNQITFDGTDNVFTAAQLQAPGLTLFAEGGPAHSDALDDITLQLRLTVNGQPGLSDTITLTAVEVTLDIALSRPAGGGAALLLPAADKVATGRFTQVRDPNFSHERTLIRISQPQPAAFTGTFTLVRSGTAVDLFAQEAPAAGQPVLPFPRAIATGTIPAAGLDLFVEGLDHSAALRDATLQLGVQDLDADGDRVRMTLVRLDIARNNLPAAAAVTLARFGLWDQAYDGVGELVADVVSNDTRRFHFRARDAGAAAGTVTLDWRTLRADQTTDDDAPASTALTLTESAAGSRHFISNGVMLVADDLDRATNTPSGLPADPARAEPRTPGQSDHRLRRARIDGFVRGEYRPPAQPAARLSITFPVFNRNPEERRRLAARVIRYNSPGNAAYRPATDAYITQQFARANQLWNRVGMQIDAGVTADRNIPAGALNPATGLFPFDHPAGAFETAVWQDLLPITPDGTLTVVFVHLTGANAYAAILDVGNIPNPAPPPATLTMGNRFFVFVGSTLALTDETLAHEIHHVVFNRGDTATGRQFWTLNTNPPSNLAAAAVPPIALPDRRIYRRVQNLNSPDPDNDPASDNIVNWLRRRRAARYPPVGGLGAATPTTGNTLVTNF